MAVELQVVEPAVVAALREELRVRAGFLDHAVFEDDDLVGFLDGGKAVRDGEHGAAFGQSLERFLDVLLGLGIERAGGLVEEQDGGVFEQRAGDAEPLLLPAGEHAAFVADDRLVALLLREDELVGVGQFRRRLDLRARGVEPAVADVREDGVVEKEGVLIDHRDVLAERGLRDLADVVPVDADRAGLRFVEPLEQPEKRALARAGRADQRAGRPGGHGDADPAHGGRVLAGVAEGHAVQRHVAAHAAEHGRAGGVLDGGRAVEQLENLGRRREAFLHEDVHLPERLGRVVEQDQAGLEREEFLDPELVVPRIDECAHDPDRRHRLDQRRDDLLRLFPAHREAQHLQIRLVETPGLVVLARVRFHHAHPGEGLLHHHHELPRLVLLARAGAAHFFPDDEHRQQAEREDGEGENREPRVDRQQGGERGEDRDRLLHDVARHLRQRGLGDPRLVENRLHEFAGFGAVEKLERLPEQMAEERAADVVEHALADPEQAVGIEVGKEAAHRHERRDGRAERRDFPQPRGVRMDFRELERHPARELHRLRLATGKNRRQHHADEQDERAIGHAKERAKKHPEQKAAAVRPQVAEQPPVWSLALAQEFQ